MCRSAPSPNISSLACLITALKPTIPKLQIPRPFLSQSLEEAMLALPVVLIVRALPIVLVIIAIVTTFPSGCDGRSAIPTVSICLRDQSDFLISMSDGASEQFGIPRPENLHQLRWGNSSPRARVAMPAVRHLYP